MPTFHKSSIIKTAPGINSDLGLLIAVANCTAFSWWLPSRAHIQQLSATCFLPHHWLFPQIYSTVELWILACWQCFVVLHHFSCWAAYIKWLFFVSPVSRRWVIAPLGSRMHIRLVLDIKKHNIAVERDNSVLQLGFCFWWWVWSHKLSNTLVSAKCSNSGFIYNRYVTNLQWNTIQHAVVSHSHPTERRSEIWFQLRSPRAESCMPPAVALSRLA